jgi:hypothetical protein
MVLRMLGISSLPTQRELYEMAGSWPLNASLLAAIMNEIWASRDGLKWQDHCFSTKFTDLQPTYDRLRAMSPYWIAHLRTPKRFGHLVVATDVAANRIDILDPEQPGSRYWMTLHEFKQIWTGSAVYLVEEVS